MQVALGSSSYDVSRRALVIGNVDHASDPGDCCQQADLLIALGADALAIVAAEPVGIGLRVNGLRSRSGVPIVVATAQLDVAIEAASAGASALLPPGLVDAAVAGGVPTAAIVLDAGDRIATNPDPTHPVVVSTGDAAGHAVAIVCGHRLLRTSDVRGARRVADVMAAILDAATGPNR